MEVRFRSNLERVRNIVVLYENTAGVKQGRPSVLEGDLLRVGVVFLHATMEDLIRDVAEARLPLAPQEILKQIPWPRAGTSAKPMLDLGDVAAFRGGSADRIIQFAVAGYLEKSNFNHPGDLKRMLEWVGLDPKLVDPYFRSLGGLMARRHWIVHRCDRNDLPGRGQHGVKSISKSSVLIWMTAVERFGEKVLSLAATT